MWTVYNILVPIFGINELSLNAVNFAVNFAERSSATPVFVRFQKDMSGKTGDNSDRGKKIEQKISGLIQNYQVEEVIDDQWLDLNDYELEIRRFVEKHDISEIVMSTPDNNDHLYPVFLEHVESLKQSTNCRIITVKGLTKRV
jgi:hypothetical protein